MKLQTGLRRWLKHSRLAFDTSILISLLAEGGADSNTIRILRLIEEKGNTLLTSTVTVLEALVHPYRKKNIAEINAIYGFLTRHRQIELIPLSPEIADKAALLRARYGFKTPDAIQLATAVCAKATLFLTRDKDFHKQKEIEVGFL